HNDGRMRTTKDRLDPAVDVCISYLCGRHACSLLHSGGIVIGTVYDDRIVVSSDERWPLPRAFPPSPRAPAVPRGDVGFGRPEGITAGRTKAGARCVTSSGSRARWCMTVPRLSST